MSAREYCMYFEEFWFLWFFVGFGILFIVSLQEESRLSIGDDPKTFLRWVIAWPILIPMWTCVWIFVLFEWLLTEVKPFQSRLDFLWEDQPIQRKQSKNQ